MNVDVTKIQVRVSSIQFFFLVSFKDVEAKYLLGIVDIRDEDSYYCRKEILIQAIPPLRRLDLPDHFLHISPLLKIQFLLYARATPMKFLDEWQSQLFLSRSISKFYIPTQKLQIQYHHQTRPQ